MNGNISCSPENCALLKFEKLKNNIEKEQRNQKCYGINVVIIEGMLSPRLVCILREPLL